MAAVRNQELDKTGRFKPLFIDPKLFVAQHQSGNQQLHDLMLIVSTLNPDNQREAELIARYGKEAQEGFVRSSDIDAGRVIKAWFTPLAQECGDAIAVETFVRVFNHIKTKDDLLNLTDKQAGKRIKRIVEQMEPADVWRVLQRIFCKCLETSPRSNPGTTH